MSTGEEGDEGWLSQSEVLREVTCKGPSSGPHAGTSTQGSVFTASCSLVYELPGDQGQDWEAGVCPLWKCFQLVPSPFFSFLLY